MVENISFWENYFLWKDAIIAAILSAAVLSYLGVWVVLKKVVYVPLALSQVSSFGVVIAFLVQDLYISFINTHHLNAHTLIDPAWVSLGLTVLLALYFAKNQQHNEISVVVSYLLASAAVLILGGFIRQDLHDIKSILFGNAVLVEPIQIIYIAIAGFLVTSLFDFSINTGGKIAHIGGALFGYLYILRYRQGKDLTKGINRILQWLLSLIKPKPRIRVTHKNFETDQDYNQRKASEQKEVDQILDKIAKSGYSSLSSKEKEILFRQSKK